MAKKKIKQTSKTNLNQEKKLDIIVKERKTPSPMALNPYPSNFNTKKTIMALFIIFLVGWLAYSFYNSAADTLQPKDIAQLPSIDKNAEDAAASAQAQANAQAENRERPEVDDVIAGKKNCTILEASELIRTNLISIESPAYLVSYVRDFDRPHYVTTYQNQTCKLYAPTRQQLKAFLSSRAYTEIPLKNSTVFVDYGAASIAPQAAYDLTMQPRIAKILDGLYDDYVEGGTKRITNTTTN